MPGADRILAAKQTGKWGLITQEGQWVISPDFDAIGLPNQDYFPGRRCPGIEWALFSFSGKELYQLPKGALEVGSPSNRLRSFETLKGWGFFDGNGVQAIEPRFSLPAGSRRGSRMLEFVSDQAAVMIESGSSKGAYGSLWLGLIDYDGSWIVEPAPDFQAFGDGSVVIYPINGPTDDPPWGIDVRPLGRAHGPELT